MLNLLVNLKLCEMDASYANCIMSHQPKILLITICTFCTPQKTCEIYLVQKIVTYKSCMTLKDFYYSQSVRRI